ncbi:hypothetical protein H9Q69_011247 [Fusarium xylarioides]|uniref:DUF7730 domain-containing protein n=1 Tax=Fusarium xylarioides TaxID=221167 RepID=A0A9P7HKT6_9HYPO|nr:hypothetical protein H9Q70_010592 [Fusarium xylarioides]KAG5762463.1 hypothetical protein H9Q72_009433 [Fusarium xylarioides]KAG5775867.1 hypothetical protein H9Q73_010461 [Fusarium xylarioides]KAG5789703.1 hypothetical protein H9Q69_011247 [Fusarium xylarioides]
MMRRYPTPPGVMNLNTSPLPSSHNGQPRRLLTPEPPQYVTVATVKANGSFFDRLPTEIRMRILRLAFGDRTVHVDLIHSYPIVEDSKRHGGLRQLPYKMKKEPGKRTGDGEVQSAIDCRLLASQTRADRGTILSHATMNASMDGTAEMASAHNVSTGLEKGQRSALLELWDGSSPASKRKYPTLFFNVFSNITYSYREGIHVLYATNTFHTASKAMILNMHDFFQQQRLNAITSFEIVWDLTPWIMTEIVDTFKVAPPLSDIETFRQFLKAIPILFLNVKKLHISLQGDMIPKSYGQNSEHQYSTKERIDVVRHNITSRVDEMVPRLKPHVDFSIAYPTSTYAVQRSLALRQGWTVKQRHETGEVERHWRPLAKCKPRTGYWVCLGDKDVRKKRARGIIGHKHMPHRVSEKQYEVFFRS